MDKTLKDNFDEEDKRNRAYFNEHFPQLASHLYADIPRGCYANYVRHYLRSTGRELKSRMDDSLQIRDF